MIRSYLLTALRHLGKNRWHTLLNIFGLSVGLASCILIYLFISHEIRYDTHHQSADNIYRVTQRYNHNSGVEHHFARCAPAYAKLLESDFPEILKAVRFNQARPLIRYGDKEVYETRFFFADPEVLEVFTFPLSAGDPATALHAPNSLVITAAMAQKYFYEDDPIGKTVSLTLGDESKDYKITGIMETPPATTHLKVDFLASFNSQEADFSSAWFWMSNFYTYLLLHENTSIANLEAQFPAFIDKHIGPGNSPFIHLVLQPLSDIHLQSHLDREIETNGNIETLYIFAIIAGFILLLALINFMNLATARSVKRAREIGMRKVLGAHKRQLVGQFLGEALLQSLAGLLVALVIVISVLPWFNNFTDKTLSLEWSASPWLIPGIVLFAAFSGLLAGIYPALYLSSFHPIQALRGSGFTAGKLRNIFIQPARLRKFLVVTQFAISISLMIATIVVYHQLTFLQQQKLGMNNEQVIVIPRMTAGIQAQYPALRTALLQHTTISGVSAVMNTPSDRILDGGHIYAEGITESLPPGENIVLPGLVVDYEFIDLMEVELLAGRNFSRNFATDTAGAYILNESAIHSLGWQTAQEAIGKGFSWRNLAQGNIVGVVKDFHFSGMKHEVEPLVLLMKPEWVFNILIKIHPVDTEAALSTIQQTWQAHFPERPLEYHFADDLFEKLYRSEARQGELMQLFSMLAIVIACLGLFGLAAFTAEQRTREIGIRKVLGAKTGGIMILLSREFIFLIIIANVLAWPLAGWAMQHWLSVFPYRVSLSPFIFILAGLAALLIAILTISYQTVKAAWTNPVNALHHD